MIQINALRDAVDIVALSFEKYGGLGLHLGGRVERRYVWYHISQNSMLQYQLHLLERRFGSWITRQENMSRFRWEDFEKKLTKHPIRPYWLGVHLETRWNTPERLHKPSGPISRISIFRPKSCLSYWGCYSTNHFPAGAAVKTGSESDFHTLRTESPNDFTQLPQTAQRNLGREISDQVLWSKDGMTLTFGRKAPSARLCPVSTGFRRSFR